ncbi:hypothetical protein DL95DRAFT_463237 [Leptodontidium sp. 2 PMI_412]|nr:hypothetical protein DL95DRAFT_463237 [Leptodontidium sp. 2 PMI_412]
MMKPTTLITFVLAFLSLAASTRTTSSRFNAGFANQTASIPCLGLRDNILIDSQAVLQIHQVIKHRPEMKVIMKVLVLLTLLLLSLTSVVNSAPASTIGHLDSGYANHTADVASIQARWVPGEKVTTILELGDTTGGLGHPGPMQLAIDTCAPNTGDWTMCTVVYNEKSTRERWGVVMLYDNWCNRIGHNDHVARNWLSSTYSLSLALRMYVNIMITNAWTDSMSKSVVISYHERLNQKADNSTQASHSLSILTPPLSKSQMSTTTMKTITLLTLLFLSLISPVILAPAAGRNSILDENLSHAARDTTEISTILSPLDNAWVSGEPAVIFVESGPRNIYYKSCEPNKGDQYQCTVSFVQSNAADYAYMWIYDYECRQIGFYGHVPRVDLADRFSMSSQLPSYVDVNIERGWNPTHPSGVKVWYGAFYSGEPFLLPPQQWLPQLNREILESNQAGRFWWVFRIPFLCA